MPWYLLLPVALALLIVPFLLGTYLARKLRMPDHGWKIGVILCALACSSVITATRWPPKLGIDLSGGVILVYEVDPQKKQAGQKVDMEKLVAAVSRRVNPGGQKEVTIRPYGQDQIEIIIPEVNEQDVKQIEDIISKTGTLEFRILANNRDHRSTIERAQEDSQVVKDSAGHVLGWWVPVEKGQEADFALYGEIARRIKERKGQKILEILVVNDDFNVTGQYLSRVSPSVDERGRPCVQFVFNSAGGQLFGRFTGENLPDPVQEFTRKLAIILDGQLHSAPSIQSTIFNQGQITGSFTEKEVDALVNVLTAGSLPAALSPEPISRLYSGPTLGRDTIQKSSYAMILSSILVPLFMLWYYRFSGVVAIVALGLNMLMLVAIMITIKAAFTLPGLAGLALTVGMAVDNNVLIYERLREELHRGSTLRMAIRNAFHRAGVVIIDTNLTHLIAATVLFVVGTDQVKGFAVTFWLGAVISMWTAVFVARVIFDIAEKQQWITKLKMLQAIGETNIDFMGWFPVCATASVLVTVVGLVIAVLRGPGLLDIDFTGGVSVQTLFQQAQDVGQVRHLLRHLPDLAVSDVRVGDEPKGLRFVINTSEPDLKVVQREIRQIFGEKLVSNSMSFSDLAPIASSKAEPEKPAANPGGPSAEGHSRNDLPPDTVLALADPRWLLLAQAGPPGGKPAAGGEAPGPPKPNSTPPATPEAPGSKTSAGPPAEPFSAPESKAPAGPPAQPPGAKAPAPAETPAEKGGSPTKPPEAAADPFAGGTQARLTFTLNVNYKMAEDMITAAMKSSKVAPEPVAFELSNSQYEKDDATAYPSWDVKVQLPPEKATALFTEMKEQLKDTPYFPASSAIGGAVASGTRIQAIYALVASWGLIILYLWVRFQRVAFGVAAVIALVHDVLVMLGAIAASYYLAPFLGFLMIEPFKVNLPIVAAFLTIIGYSVNDTIVIFDRIREVRGKDPNLTVKMVNDSTNQTLSRTLLTSFTVFLVVIILYLFGGEAIHGFAFSLIVGVATGTYSSIYVAAPILLWMIGSPGPKHA